VDSCLIQSIFEESTEQGIGFRVCSKETSVEAGHIWRTHATGRVRISLTARQPDTQTWNREEVWARCSFLLRLPDSARP
jgi:hypothetical protein